jgi:GH15 family glucan-1,4-alpha-glucosidase
VGNAAVKQLQLDAYGQILEAAYLYGRAGRSLTDDNWRFIAGLADIVCERWRQPDQGIWEVRDHPRHFVHSKLNCWVALDRAVRIAGALGEPAPDAWVRERDAVSAYLCDDVAGTGWFPQAAGGDAADAATLLVPASGLLPSDHPAVHRTIDAVRARLGEEGLLRRYATPDGLEGDEGSFLLCSFWLVDCLAHAGRLDEAEGLLERLLSLANDVGLLAEEADPATGEALGNFPQAFSHLALIEAAARIILAERVDEYGVIRQ